MKTISKFQINVTPDSSFIVANFADEGYALNKLKVNSAASNGDMIRVHRIVIHDCDVTNLLYKGSGEYVFDTVMASKGDEIFICGRSYWCEEELFKCEIGYHDK